MINFTNENLINGLFLKLSSCFCELDRILVFENPREFAFVSDCCLSNYFFYKSSSGVSHGVLIESKLTNKIKEGLTYEE